MTKHDKNASQGCRSWAETPQGIQDMFFLEWDADGKRGVNHYLLGRPPFDFGTYRQWLELIRAVEPFEWDWR